MATLLSYALTDLASVKELLNIPSSDSSYNNLIIRMINKATLAIQAYTGRHFLATDYTDEEYDGTGIDQLLLKQRPIISVTSFGARDSSLNEGSFDSVDSELYFQNANAGLLNLNFRAMGRWNRYQVSYRAGYETIPADIAEACAALAAYWVVNADGSNVNVSSKKEGQRQINYSNQTPVTFSNIVASLGIDTILDSYRDYQIGAA